MRKKENVSDWLGRVASGSKARFTVPHIEFPVFHARSWSVAGLLLGQIDLGYLGDGQNKVYLQ